MQVCTSLQADYHASTPQLSFLQEGCPSCHPTNSVKALKANNYKQLEKLSNSNFLLTTHTHPFNGPMSGTTWMSRYQKGQTNPNFTEERDSEWQWHQLDHMQVCTLLQTDNHNQHPTTEFLKARCASCCQPAVSKHRRQTQCV